MINSERDDTCSAYAGEPEEPCLHAAISARLDRLPATRSLWRLVILLSLGFFFELYDLLYSAYVIPGLVESGLLNVKKYGVLQLDGVAWFISSLFAGLFIGTLVCGFLADRFGRRVIFTWSLLWYSAANVVLVFQQTAEGIMVWRFIAGLGLGVEMVTIGTYIVELVPKQIRGRAFACEMSIGFLAVPVVAFLSYWLVPRAPFGIEGWRWVVLLGSVGAGVVWWLRRGLPESPRWLAQQGRIDEADRILTYLETQVERESGQPLPEPDTSPLPPMHVKLRDALRPPYVDRIAMMVIFNLLQTVGFYGFMNWVPTLLIAQGITVTQSLLYASLIAIAAPLGPLLGMWFADRVERKHIIVGALGLSVVCGVTLGFSSSDLLIVLLCIVITLANNSMAFSYHAYQAELFPTPVRARLVGFVYSWSRFSAIFTAFIIAAVLDHFGVSGVFMFISGVMLIAMAVIGLMGPKTRNIALERI